MLLNTGRKTRSCGRRISVWFWTFWFGNAGKIAIWTFLSGTRILHLKAQRRGREETTEVVLEGIHVHNIMENEMKCGMKNSV